MSNYKVTGAGEDTEITFMYDRVEVNGHLNTLICDGGFYHDNGEDFTEFNQATLAWLEKIDEHRPE